MPSYRNLYNDIYDKLTSSTSIIKTVEDFNNQYNNMEEFNNIKFPCVYIETGEVVWDKSENKYVQDVLTHEPQTGTANIKLHIVYHTLKPFNRDTREEFFSIVDYVSNIIQKSESGNRLDGCYTTLMRTKEEYITPVKQLRVAIFTFETKMRDVFTERTDYITETVTMVLNQNYNL